MLVALLELPAGERAVREAAADEVSARSGEPQREPAVDTYQVSEKALWALLRVSHLCGGCSAVGRPSARGCLAAGCGTSGGAGVGPPGSGTMPSGAPPWSQPRARKGLRPIWSAPSHPGRLSGGRWGAQPGTAVGGGPTGGTPGCCRSAAAAGCCQPSGRRRPGTAAASEPASGGSAVCRGAPPSCPATLTSEGRHFIEEDGGGLLPTYKFIIVERAAATSNIADIVSRPLVTIESSRSGGTIEVSQQRDLISRTLATDSRLTLGAKLRLQHRERKKKN